MLPRIGASNPAPTQAVLETSVSDAQVYMASNSLSWFYSQDTYQKHKCRTFLLLIHAITAFGYLPAPAGWESDVAD